MTLGYKNYEFAYLFSSSSTESEVLTLAEKLSTLINEAKGTVKRVEEPKRRKLAYPIKKQKEAYWGWITFSMAPENIKALEKKLKGVNVFLRYLLVEEEIETRPQIFRALPRPITKPRPVPRATETQPAEKLDLEALDKKLEDILGK